MINIQAPLKNLQALKQDLSLLTLPPKVTHLIIKRTAQAIKNNALKNVRNQQTPDGRKWQKRKVGTGKMLRHRASYLNTKIDNPKTGMLYYKYRRTGEISAIHQYGLEDLITQNRKLTKQEKQYLRQKNEGENKHQITKEQITRLIALGYTIKTKTGKEKLATVNEIKKRLPSRGKAGITIRKLKEKIKKESGHTIKARGIKMRMPERPFLDTNEQRNGKIMLVCIERVLNEYGIKFK
ncbi:phage virion morphogenesis protein [Mannheimia sp. E30BD]|uniref:phage virion morphogenesis protein n=1 Tax=Mannheimia sp. E30BD TaxID=3278708 RepID=UPI00359EBEE8